jgi:hypothetical protein
LLDSDFNNSQIIFNNASTAGFDNTRNIALMFAFISNVKRQDSFQT